MTLIGLDLNASRVRAVSGPAGAPPRLLALDGLAELPLALSLENRRQVQVGAAGLALSRRLPHMACVNFLPWLGEKRQWNAGRHRLDAGQALSLVLEKLQPNLAGAEGLVAALPAYLSPPQVAHWNELANRAKLPVWATVAAPLAAGAAGYARQPWTGSGLVIQADDQALTLALVTVEAGPQPGLLVEQVLPLAGCGLRAWTERLINGIADRCIRQSRRDPRDSGEAEQHLFEQLPAALGTYTRGQVIELGIQAPQWYQHLLLRPEELDAFCASLARQAADGLRTLLGAGPCAAVIFTPAAARLPGLQAAVLHRVGAQTPGVALPAEGIAAGAHDLAGRSQEGILGPGHHDVKVPLPQRMLKPEIKPLPPPGRLRLLDSGF
jgi:hypothetical protein